MEKNEQRNRTNLGDQIKMVEYQMKNMENFNFSMANQMLNILKSLNDKIVNLSGRLKARGLVVEEDGKDNDEDRMEEGATTNITQSHTDQSYEKDQELLTKEI